MTKILKLSCIVIIACGISACNMLDQLLVNNMFESPLEISVSEISSMSISEISEEAESPDFYELLEDDPAVMEAVITQVDTVIENPASTAEDIQIAAIIGASVLIETSTAAELIGNLINEIPNLEDPPQDDNGTPFDTSDDFIDIAALTEILVPDSVYSDGEIKYAEFVELIDSLVVANEYFEALGNSIAVDTTDPDNPEAEYLIGDVNEEEIAQNALVAALISGVAIPQAYSDANDNASVGMYLYDLITDSENVDPPDDFEFPETDSGYLNAIILAAGFDATSIGF